jgi:hypothetical protein
MASSAYPMWWLHKCLLVLRLLQLIAERDITMGSEYVFAQLDFNFPKEDASLLLKTLLSSH